MLRRLSLALTLLATAVPAQTWQGLILGAPLPADMPPPDQSTPVPLPETVRKHLPERVVSMCMHGWSDDRVTTLAAMTNGCDGPVLAIMGDNGLFSRAKAPAGVAGFTYGVTTYAEAAAHFGSKGLQSAESDALSDAFPKLTYEIAGEDAVLVLHFSHADADAEGTSDAPLQRHAAWLSAVVLMDRDLHHSEPDNRSLAPSLNYRPLPESLFP